MKKIITKKEIEDIVNQTFYDLGYKKKYTKEYYLDLVNNTMQNINWDMKAKEDYNDDDVVEEVKCPKYISSLPGNLKTSTSEELQHRLDVIDDKIGELEEKNNSLEAENEYLQDKIDGIQSELDNIHETEEEVNSLNKDIHDFALKSIDKIQTNIKKALKKRPSQTDTLLPNANTIPQDLEMLPSFYEYGNGLIPSYQGAVIKNLEDYFRNYIKLNENTLNKTQIKQINTACDELNKLESTTNINKLEVENVVFSSNLGKSKGAILLEGMKTVTDAHNKGTVPLLERNMQKNTQDLQNNQKEIQNNNKKIDNFNKEKTRTTNAKKEKDKQNG